MAPNESARRNNSRRIWYAERSICFGICAGSIPVNARDGRMGTDEQATNAGPARQPTTEKLALALEAVPGMPAQLIKLARAGHYDDYKSSLALPLWQLRHDLLNASRAMTYTSRMLVKALIRDVVEGEFDGTKEESEAWARTPEGQEALRAFGPRP
jgi:hypothetical protein